MTKTIELLVPISEHRINKAEISPHVHDLNGKVVGFLWDEKPNGNVLLQRIREKVSQSYKLGGTVWKQVGGVHIAAEEAGEITQLADTTDTVIVAVGD